MSNKFHFVEKENIDNYIKEYNDNYKCRISLYLNTTKDISSIIVKYIPMFFIIFDDTSPHFKYSYLNTKLNGDINNTKLNDININNDLFINNDIFIDEVD